jgi:hypothetical protein
MAGEQVDLVRATFAIDRLDPEEVFYRLSLPKMSSEPEFEPEHKLTLNWGEK